MESSPDIIIGTHPFTALIISRLKQKKNLKVPFISIITDFKAHAAYINNNVDAYITGSDYTKEHLVKNKIPPNIIYPLGIPVRESFCSNNSIIPKIKDTEYFSILLMSGSMGLNNISYVFGLKKLILDSPGTRFPKRPNIFILVVKSSSITDSIGSRDIPSISFGPRFIIT